MLTITRSCALSLFLGLCLCAASTANAQITPPRILSATQTRVATFSEYLINQLRATNTDQQNYVREVVNLVNQGRLERRLILGLTKHARRKSPRFPLVIFERSLKVEAAKRGVPVPMINDIVARNAATATGTVMDSRVR